MTEPEVEQAITDHLGEIENLDLVDAVVSPYSPMFSGLISDDETAALINLQLTKQMTEMTDADRDELVEAAQTLQSELPAGYTVNMGGSAFSVTVPGLTPTEMAGVLVALVVLTFTLGSLVAAGLPILNAVVGVGVSMLIIMIAAGITNISATTPLLAVMLALAVGIDYALFIISRHRDQLGEGIDPEESTARAIGTAGSAVVFAGTTVFVALLGLGLSRIPFLTVMGVFAAVAVAIAVLIALTLLPAMLGFMGARLTPKPRKIARKDPDKGFFARWVQASTKIPALTIAVVVVILGALSVPAANLWMSLPNSGQNPAGQADRITYDLITEHFGPGYNSTIIVTADIVTSTDPLGVMAGLKEDIEAIEGVDHVALATPNQNADLGIVQLIPTTASDDPATAELVQRLVDQHDTWQEEFGVDTAVTGITPVQIDVSQRLTSALLPFGIFVVGLCFVLLMMVFRSIWVPVKATLGYLLSVGAAFGATQLVFNQGIGRAIVNLEKPTAIISFMPIVIMGILFGLAMDYEVFLVSRIREEYVHGLRNHPEMAPRDVARQAIRTGFTASGKVVASAAVIMFAVFAFFIPHGIGPIKQIAFGLAVGVAVDAFLVRMTLVPAVLQLLGERAWGLPTWLDRILPSFDVEGESLTHLMEHSNWPTPEHTEALHVEGVRAAGLFQRLDLHVDPGQVAVLLGDPKARSAAMLTLAGRMQVTHGMARVATKLLPEEAGKVRRATGFVEVVGNAAIAEDLDSQLRHNPKVIFVDGADGITNPADAAALDRVIAAARTDRELAVVLGVTVAASSVTNGADLTVTVRAPQPTPSDSDTLVAAH